MVGRQQPAALGDDAVPVMVGVAGEGKIESVLHPDQPLHGVRGGGVHANLAVPIHGHKTKGGVNLFVDDGQVQTVSLGDAPPIMDAGAAQGIHPRRTSSRG